MTADLYDRLSGDEIGRVKFFAGDRMMKALAIVATFSFLWWKASGKRSGERENRGKECCCE